MIAGQKLNEFTASQHFLDRWFERTDLPSNYFECIIEEGLYTLLDTRIDMNQKEQRHYMFYSAHVTKYFMFIVADGVIKTILTEKMYKEFYSIHLQRAKKDLKTALKSIKERYSNVEYAINNVIVQSTVVEFNADPIWERLNNFNNFHLTNGHKMMDNTSIYRLLLLPSVPILDVCKIEILIDGRPIKYYNKTLTMNEKVQLRRSKNSGSMILPIFHNRKRQMNKSKK